MPDTPSLLTLLLAAIACAVAIHRARQAERRAGALAEQNAKLRDISATAYAAGYEEATAIVNAQRDVELVAARNRAYTAGLDEAQGRRSETKVRAA